MEASFTYCLSCKQTYCDRQKKARQWGELREESLQSGAVHVAVIVGKNDIVSSREGVPRALPPNFLYWNLEQPSA